MTRETVPPGRTAAEARGVLRERARNLARVRSAPVAAESMLEVLEFQLADERYAVESRYVGEVQPLRSLTPVPCTPAFILGIVNVRGRILPVLDLKRFFGLPQRGLTDLHRIILLGDGRCEFGLLADLGVGVRMIPRAAIQASPPAFAGIDSTYLLGVTADRLLVLDAAALLADPRLVVDERSDEDG